MKLQQLTEKICELLHDTDLCVRKQVDNKWQICIGEAEVLKAIGSLYVISGDGMIYEYCDSVCDNETYICTEITWQLGKHLSEQSEETINFLHEILVNENN